MPSPSDSPDLGVQKKTLLEFACPAGNISTLQVFILQALI
jgi:hypothetical protein